MTTGKDDLTKASQLGSKDGYPGCPECKPGDGKYHLEALGFSDALRFSGKMDVVQKSTPHEMYGFFLQNQSVLTEDGNKTNGWEAHRACMGKGDKKLCDRTTFSAELYEDDFTAHQAVTLLQRRDKDKPFFLHVSFPGPHDPFLVTAAMRAAASDGRVWPPATDDPKNNTPGGACSPTGEPDNTRVRCNYAAEIENLDRLFKVVLDEVTAQGVMDNTVVCIASDHGEMLGDHGDVDKSKPWEGSSHVPLMCAGPGIKKGVTVDIPVATMDMAGTFMDYASAKPAPGMTTVSWRSLLEGNEAASYPNVPEASSSYRSFVSSGLDNFRMVVKVIGGVSYKFICCKGKCPNPPSNAPAVSKSGWMQMLIAPKTDPYDMNDLAPTKADIVTELRALLPPTYATGCATIEY
jgi:arylsulfatase A-like enzyme